MLRDFSVQTDDVIEAQRLDLVVDDKKERSCKIIDFAVPVDSRIEEKEKDKIEKYQYLGRELQKIWNVKVEFIPLVLDSLGAIPKQFGIRLKHYQTLWIQQDWYYSRNSTRQFYLERPEY